jgi:tape measure domain-containing protein
MALDMNAAVRINAFVNGVGQIEGLEKSLNRVDKGATGLSGAFQRLSNAGKSLGGVLASIGLGALANTMATAGVEADRTQKRIANLAGPLKETKALMDFAGEAAKKYGIGQTQAANAVADLYGRLRPTGVSLDKIKTAFTGVNNAAAAMNLTADQTDNVMLQLSQALGSGKLQGDEFRSVMEQLPSIGQAVASVLGTDVAGLKQLATDGKITSDVLLQALGKLAQQKPPPPDAYKQFQAALADLQTTIGTKLLPALTPLVQFASMLLNAFSSLPGPLQTVIVAVGALAAAFVILAPAIAAIITIGPALAGLAAGFAALGPIVAGLGTVLAVVFTGPVGIAALVIAAGVAIYAFRDQIGAAFTAIGEYFKQLPAGFQSFFIDPLVEGFRLLMEMINTTFIQPLKDAFTATLEFVNVNFVQPIQAAFTALIQSIKTIFSAVVNIITSPFKAAFETVRGIVNEILNGIGSAIDSVVSAINSVIRGANAALAALKLPQIPLLPAAKIPKFAEGGVVSGPTLAMVGEGGEPEYIVPQSKATKFANNWLSGVRGAAAIPKFAEGGMVVPGSAQVSIQTGPVTQMNGTNFVTTQDLSSAVSAGVSQTLSLLRNDMNTRRAVGLA